MNRAFQRFNAELKTTILTIGIAALLAAWVPAQAQQSSSLADAARQARAQRQAQAQSASPAQQIANELSEDQNDSAPGGFKTYNAGDYKLWVPAPYRVEGNDPAGVVLSGPQVGTKIPMLMLGTPIVGHWQNNDAAFEDAATQFVRLYEQSAHCSKTTVASNTAYQCGLAAANLLGKRVSGNAYFVWGAGNIYPVFCVTPSDSRNREVLNNQRVDRGTKEWAQEGLSHELDDVRVVWQKCETVVQSIRISPRTAESNAAALTKPAAEPAGTPTASSGSGSGSLADIARGLHQQGAAQGVPASVPSTSAPETASAAGGVPSGSKVQAFIYCKTASQCYNASVLVPNEAQLVSSDCKQYIFETKVQGAPFLLLAGTGGDGCTGHGKGDTNQVRWDELAQPESGRAPGTFTLVGSLQATLDGKPAVITQILFRKGTTTWMGKRAEIDSNGVPLVVGCMAPREHFADGDAICSGLMDSLRLP